MLLETARHQNWRQLERGTSPQISNNKYHKTVTVDPQCAGATFPIPTESVSCQTCLTAWARLNGHSEGACTDPPRAYDGTAEQPTAAYHLPKSAECPQKCGSDIFMAEAQMQEVFGCCSVLK